VSDSDQVLAPKHRLHAVPAPVFGETVDLKDVARAIQTLSMAVDNNFKALHEELVDLRASIDILVRVILKE
jgi:hypothetical protein